MTYRENCTLPESLLEQIAEQGRSEIWVDKMDTFG